MNTRLNANLSIAKKGVLLISVPLAFQLVFAGIFLATQRRIDEAQKLAEHSREVLAQVEAVYRRLIEGQGALGRLLLTGDLDRYERAGRAFPGATADAIGLVSLVGDDPAQQAKAREIRDQVASRVAWQEGVVGLVREGRRDEAVARARDPDVPDRLDALRGAIEGFRAEEERLERGRERELVGAARGQAGAMIAGGLASLAGSVWLLLYFSRGLARRFAVLGENARRLAEGHDLVPPLAGTDEIARLDGVFRDMARAIAEKDRENELFIYSVSHDLRSPLVNLQGFSQELGFASRELRGLLSDPAVPAPTRDRGVAILDGEVDESIRFIQTAVSRLSVIIDALLRLSRAGRVEYHWQAVDVGATVRRVVDALGSTIAGRGAKVEAGPLPAAWGDPTAIEQVFANLIGNAANYLDPERPGRIEIGAVDGEAPSNGVPHFTYYVRDNGLGIPESGLPKLFLAFQRFHESRARGEGIGLALVRKIVERHGGKIRVESELGSGTTFYVDLPGPPADAPAGPDPRESPPAKEAAR